MKRLLPLALIAALSLPAGATNAQTEIVPDTLTEATGPGEDAARAAFQLREATGRLEDALSQTPLSQAIARDMKKRGFSFMGPTVVYAYMQAAGLVNDHVISCPGYLKSRG